MARRGYHQYCGIARALDVLGERWTLLLVRNLLLGPQRFKDLLDGLPGIGTNLLAERLRELEDAGVIKRTRLAPPASSAVYELTEYGRELEEPILALSRWGARALGAPRSDDFYQPAWLLLSFRALFRPERGTGVHETYELQIDEHAFIVVVDDGAIDVSRGNAPKSDLVIRCDANTFLSIALGKITAKAAKKSGQLQLFGSEATFARFLRLFPLPARATA